MNTKADALIGLIDGYLAKKNHLPANAIKEELKRVKVLEDALQKIAALGNCIDVNCMAIAKQALGENHV